MAERAERFAPIEKPRGRWRVPPNLVDYEAERARFTWTGARTHLAGLPGGRGLHIAHEAVDRHAAGPRAERVAIRWRGRRGEQREISYAALRAETNRFANALRGLGVVPGDVAFALIGRVPELYVAALGALKAGAVFSPLFSAFGPDPIRQRLELGDARLLITSTALYERKVAGLRAELPRLEHVIVVGDGAPPPGTRAWPALLAGASDAFEIPATDPSEPALLHFTSGTTGTPKGALHVHEAVVAHHATGRHALDLPRTTASGAPRIRAG